MKNILTFLLSIVTFSVAAQDTTYHDYYGKIVSSINTFHHYKIIERNQTDTNIVVERVYLKEGQIKFERNYNPYSEKKPDGKRKEWYDNGQIKKDIDYRAGKMHGQLLTYYENGQIQRQDSFDNGEFVKGKTFSMEGKETPHTDYIIMPKFDGGTEGFLKFMSKELKYPKKSRKKNIEGRVIIKFIVEIDGAISNIHVVQSVNKELDAEALRVVKKIPKWEPGMEDGEPIRVSYSVPVLFRLE